MVGSDVPGAEKLADFFRSTERQITPELSEILEVIATTGKVWHDWNHLKALIAVRMNEVLDTYNKSRLAVDVGPPRPLLGGETFEDLQKRLHSLLEAISGPPFTIQRLCEVLLWPQEMYTTIDKLALAIEKLLMVTQTVPLSSDPYPPLPLPPHQPPPPRKPPPQQIQPRLSFGHQPHPEANPDQIEEHELNQHQNHQVHPRGQIDGPKQLPSFLEDEKNSFGSEGGGGKAFPGMGGQNMHHGGGGESRPAFLDTSSSEMLEGGESETSKKRSFEDAAVENTDFVDHANEGVQSQTQGGFQSATEALSNASEMDTADGGAEDNQLHGHEDVPRGSLGAVQNPVTLHAPIIEGRSLEVAPQPMQEPTIEPMTPPSTIDAAAGARSIAQHPSSVESEKQFEARVAKLVSDAQLDKHQVSDGQVDEARKEERGGLIGLPAEMSGTAQEGDKMEEG